MRARAKAEYVSIHAPVKGATNINELKERLENVSIHAPVKGATVAVKIQFPVDVPVSIHAPVKGATTAGADGRRV